MAHFNKRTCPLIKMCRRRILKKAFDIPAVIAAAALLIFMKIYAGAAFSAGYIIWRLFSVEGRLKETAKYLETLSDDDYGRLISQLDRVNAEEKSVYLLDGWLLDPTVPILARTDEITDVRWEQVRGDYRITLSYRGITIKTGLIRIEDAAPEILSGEQAEEQKDYPKETALVTHFDKKNCPIMKMCRREKFGDATEIFILLPLVLIYSVGVAGMAGAIGAAFFVCFYICKYSSIVRKLNRLSSYLETLSDKDYVSLISQLDGADPKDDRLYMLDRWLFDPLSLFLAQYNEITGIEWESTSEWGYTMIVKCRGKKYRISHRRNKDMSLEGLRKEILAKARTDI